MNHPAYQYIPQAVLVLVGAFVLGGFIYLSIRTNEPEPALPNQPVLEERKEGGSNISDDGNKQIQGKYEVRSGDIFFYDYKNETGVPIKADPDSFQVLKDVRISCTLAGVAKDDFNTLFPAPWGGVSM